jgi:DNA-binding transcriptional ArsR family regulator
MTEPKRNHGPMYPVGLPTTPSVEAVYRALGPTPRTGRQLREATGLPRRTIYAALMRLRESGVLHERASLKDTRQTYYWLAAAPMEQEAAAATA